MGTLSPDQLDVLVADLEGCYEDGQPAARMSANALKAGRDSGLFTMTSPPNPCSLPDYWQALRRVVAVEPGVAWAAMNSLVFGHAVARLKDHTRDDLLGRGFQGPFAFSGLPGGRAVAVDGGFEVTGSWPFLTAGQDADLALLQTIVEGGDRPDLRLFIVDPADIEIGTNWEAVAGLRTSGSNSADISSIRVDESLTISMTAPVVVDHPLYRLPVSAYFFGSMTANFLGIFRGAVDGAIDLINSKISSASGQPAGNNPATQLAVSEAEAALRACEAALDEVVYQLWDEVKASGDVSIETRAAAYRTYLFIADTGRSAISRLYGASTTLGWRQDSSVTRPLMDLHAISVTYEGLRRLQTEAGGLLLNTPPTDPRF